MQYYVQIVIASDQSRLLDYRFGYRVQPHYGLLDTSFEN